MYPMPRRTLGKRIRQLREQRGLSRQELAEATGLSAVYLKKLEAGDRESPSLPALEKIARALHVRLYVELR